MAHKNTFVIQKHDAIRGEDHRIDAAEIKGVIEDHQRADAWRNPHGTKLDSDESGRSIKEIADEEEPTSFDE